MDFNTLKLTSIAYVIAALFLTTESLRQAPSNNVDPITALCKKTTYYDLCMSILFEDRRKYQCDTKGLAKIVMEKDMHVAKQILSQVQSLARDSHNHHDVRVKCGHCAREYNAIVSTLLPGANKNLASGKFASSIQELNSVAQYARACDDQFSKGNMTEPFVNMSVHDIALVAVGILKTII